MNTLNEFLEYIHTKKKDIICFGTGLMAENAQTNEEICRATKCFLDNDKNKQMHTARIGNGDFLVISPEVLKDYLNEQTIILITSGHYKEIHKQLLSLDLPNTVEIYDYPVLKVNMLSDSEIFFEERILKECIKEYEVVLDQYNIEGEERKQLLLQKEEYIRGKDTENRPFVVPRVMIMPTTRCNLRCKGCSSLLPLFTHPKDIDISQIINDCNVFFSGIDECIRLTIGGEPFLYPQLKELLEYLINEPKLLGIMLITNGMLIPRDEVINLLKNKKIFIEVSDYGKLEQMSKMVSVLENNGINFVVLTEQKWTDMGGIEFRNRSIDELRFVYLNCDQSRVIKGMHDGRFHTCARSARMLSLGAYKSDNDYFELKCEDAEESIRNKLMDIFYSDHADACNYCDLGALPTRVIEAGIQENNGFTKSKYTIISRDEYEELKRWSNIVDEDR